MLAILYIHVFTYECLWIYMCIYIYIHCYSCILWWFVSIVWCLSRLVGKWSNLPRAYSLRRVVYQGFIAHRGEQPIRYIISTCFGWICLNRGWTKPNRNMMMITDAIISPLFKNLINRSGLHRLYLLFCWSGHVSTLGSPKSFTQWSKSSRYLVRVLRHSLLKHRSTSFTVNMHIFTSFFLHIYVYTYVIRNKIQP